MKDLNQGWLAQSLGEISNTTIVQSLGKIQKDLPVEVLYVTLSNYVMISNLLESSRRSISMFSLSVSSSRQRCTLMVEVGVLLVNQSSPV